MTSRIRNGRGKHAYNRKRDQLRRRVANENLPCGHGSDYGCGQPIDTTLPRNHPLSFTADHPVALANGGHLVRQELVPMHRRCNSVKGEATETELWEAT